MCRKNRQNTKGEMNMPEIHEEDDVPREVTLMEAKLLTPDTWADFEAFFARYHGVWGGCWCTFHLCSSSDFTRMTKDERREYHRRRVLEGRASGLLLYDRGEAIAWCQFGKAQDFERNNRNRAYKALALPESLTPDWRITCLFVDRSCRKRGLMSALAEQTLKAITARGGGIVEAFPHIQPENTRPAYTGTIRLYEKLGFEQVAQLGKSTLLMRKVIHNNA